MHPAVAAPSDGEQPPPPPPPPSSSSPPRESTDRSRPLTVRDGHAPRSHSGPGRSTSNMISVEEYDALPPSIQKKYFSSVERLRIAQQAASQRRKKHQPSKEEPWSSPKPSLDFERPQTAHSFRTPPSFQSKRHIVSRTDADVNEDQAIRFLSLPDKVKRSHFTQEELTLLSESSERALGISVTSDDSVSRRTTFDRNGSVGSSHYQSSTSGELDELEEKDWCDLEMLSAAGSEPGVREMEILRMYARSRQGSVNSLLSSHAPSTFDGSHSGPRLKSFSKKRAVTLAPLPLPPPTLLPAVPPLPPSMSLQTMGTAKSPVTVVTPTESSGTKYYKDSDARSKLREYLASPEKFDEALEFGFPTERAMEEFSGSFTLTDGHMETLSVANSKDDDLSSHGSPRTPAEFSDCYTSTATPNSSVDSGVAIPSMSSGKIVPRSLSPDLGGREMTLRMTLTRPELRAPEQELYAFQRRQVSGVDVDDKDPLALETLSICDDHSGAHGAFAVSRPSKGGFKQVWKNLRSGRSAS